MFGPPKVANLGALVKAGSEVIGKLHHLRTALAVRVQPVKAGALAARRSGLAANPEDLNPSGTWVRS